MNSRSKWRNCTADEQIDRAERNQNIKPRKSGWVPPTYEHTVMITGDIKSGPGYYIRKAFEDAAAKFSPSEFVYKTS